MADNENKAPDKKLEQHKPAAAPHKSERKQNAAAEKIIYLGPPMIERDPSGKAAWSINYGAIFENGLPADVLERQKADKDFARMFVPVKNSLKAFKDLMDKNSDLFETSKRVQQGYIERKRNKGRR